MSTAGMIIVVIILPNDDELKQVMASENIEIKNRIEGCEEGPMNFLFQFFNFFIVNFFVIFFYFNANESNLFIYLLSWKFSFIYLFFQ